MIHPDREGRGSARHPQARLEEAAGLALALDLEVRETMVVTLRQLTPATLFGKGKVEEIRILVEVEAIDVVVIDDALTPGARRSSTAPGLSWRSSPAGPAPGRAACRSNWRG